jgi:polyisoprenoid-binding protein YceI
MGLFNRTKATRPAGVTEAARATKETGDRLVDGTSTAMEDIAGDYAIDPTHTRLGFSARHAMVTKVRGQFNDFEGSAHVDTVNPANSSVTVAIKADSVSTGNEQRDAHLRNSDFFDVEAYPEITFVSTHVERDGDEWDITGDLTINGVTKPVTIEFEETGSAKDPFGNTRVGFEGDTTIDRRDWGLTFQAALETGGVMISDRIKLEFDISAIAQVPSEA